MCGTCCAEAVVATANLTERLRLRALKFGTVLPPASRQSMAAARPGAAAAVRAAASGSPPGGDLAGHAQRRGREARQLLQGQRQDGRQERNGRTEQLASQGSSRNACSGPAQQGPAHGVQPPARHALGSGSLRGSVPRPHRALQEALVLDAPVVDSKARGDRQRHRRDQQPSQRDQHGSRHFGGSFHHRAGASGPPETTAVPAGEVRGRVAAPLLQCAALPPPAETKKRKGRGFSDPGASARSGYIVPAVRSCSIAPHRWCWCWSSQPFSLDDCAVPIAHDCVHFVGMRNLTCRSSPQTSMQAGVCRV